MQFAAYTFTSQGCCEDKNVNNPMLIVLNSLEKEKENVKNTWMLFRSTSDLSLVGK